MQALTEVNLPDVKPIYRGKVRELYEVDKENLILVTTDRLSAFDVVFPQGIPEKGIILNRISNHWFSLMDFVPNHLVETQVENFPEPFCRYVSTLKDRSVLVKRAKRIPVECVVRGYLMGSAWKEYQEKQEVANTRLEKGLSLGAQLPQPLFTPAIKNDQGHDENIDFEKLKSLLGKDLALKLQEISLAIYQFAHNLLKKAGILILDSKFEFGFYDEKLILIDELVTPDSSRFCLLSEWEKSQKEKSIPPSLDKQIIRNYLNQIGWDKKSPPPLIPPEIIQATVEKYKFMEEKILCFTKPQ